jgi:transposase-like protein
MAYRKFKPEFRRRVVEEWVPGGKRIAELEAGLGRATLEVDSLRPALTRAGIPFPSELKW